MYQLLPLLTPIPVTAGRGSSALTCCHFLKTAQLCRALPTQQRNLWKNSKVPFATAADGLVIFIGCRGTDDRSHSPLKCTPSFKNEKVVQRYGLKAWRYVCRRPHCTCELLIPGAMSSRLLQEKIINALFCPAKDLWFFFLKKWTYSLHFLKWNITVSWATQTVNAIS